MQVPADDDTEGKSDDERDDDPHMEAKVDDKHTEDKADDKNLSIYSEAKKYGSLAELNNDLTEGRSDDKRDKTPCEVERHDQHEAKVDDHAEAKGDDQHTEAKVDDDHTEAKGDDMHSEAMVDGTHTEDKANGENQNMTDKQVKQK